MSTYVDTCKSNVVLADSPDVDPNDAVNNDNNGDDSNDNDSGIDKQDGDSNDDATNLSQKIDGGFVSEQSAENGQGAGFGYGVITGFAVTLGLVALIAVAYFAYTRASPRNAKREADVTNKKAGVRSVEDEENNGTETQQNSAGRLSGARRIVTEEENLAHTMKNLNGNPFADHDDSNKVAREIQA